MPICSSHHVVHQPRLSPHLGDDPSKKTCQIRERQRIHHDLQIERAGLQPVPFDDPDEREQDEQEAEPHHDAKGAKDEGDRGSL